MVMSYKTFLTEASKCPYYNGRDDTCKKGCKEKNVKKGDICPFSEEGFDCPGNPRK